MLYSAVEVLQRNNKEQSDCIEGVLVSVGFGSVGQVFLKLVQSWEFAEAHGSEELPVSSTCEIS